MIAEQRDLSGLFQGARAKYKQTLVWFVLCVPERLTHVSHLASVPTMLI